MAILSTITILALLYGALRFAIYCADVYKAAQRHDEIENRNRKAYHQK